MITVKTILELYCHQRELPPPSSQDLLECGRFVSHHFKRFWAKDHFDGLIPDCGFIVTIEGGKKIVTHSYPDVFKPEMEKRIDLYYLQKSLAKTPPKVPNKELPNPTEIKPPRKRKSVQNVQKVASVKPSNALGQIQGQ